MSLTCVTGYWNIKNKHGNKFEDWFENTLAVNNPYIIFSDKEGIESMKKYRDDLPTHYIEMDIDEFYMQKYKDKIAVHSTHCPSVELNMVWNEKIFLLQKAYKTNPFNSEFFHWIDAGICTYRQCKPPSCEFSKDKIKSLPMDKFIYSSSMGYDINRVSTTSYYHHISGTYILHKNIINKFVDLYKSYLEQLMERGNIWTDQVIWTHIYKDHKELFYMLCGGYGTIVTRLY
jgi:hypothetical protein